MTMSITTWFYNQRKHFNVLTNIERRLLISFFLFALASPIIWTFMNTFLWRIDQDPVLLIIFNVGFYAALPFGFFLNALLLRWTDTPVLYVVGCLLQGAVPLTLVSLGNRAADLILWLGIALGIAGGLFWANRNYLTSKVTTGAHRFYFLSMENAFSTAASIVAPISIGWMLTFGERFALYSVTGAYRFAAVMAFIALCAAGLAVYKAGLDRCDQRLNQYVLRKAGKVWNTLRGMEFLNGFVDGIEVIIPVVIILTFLGAEETVGTIETLSSIVSAVLLVIISKHVTHKSHFLILLLWMIGSLMGGLAFATLFTSAGALIYFTINAFVGTFRWSSLATVMYEIVDRFSARGEVHRFVYIMDREIFLGLGRLSALGVIYLLYTSIPETSIRFGLLLIVVAQLILLFTIRPILKHILHEKTPVDIVPNEPAP